MSFWREEKVGGTRCYTENNGVAQIGCTLCPENADYTKIFYFVTDYGFTFVKK
jgi:hypothetical protein